MISDNRRAVQDAAAIQEDTLEALRRIEQQASEAEAAGVTTLAELQEHREKMDRILKEGDRLHDQLDTTHKLQNRLGRWGLKFNNRKAAQREVDKAKSSIKAKEVAAIEREIKIAPTVESMSPPSSAASNNSSGTNNGVVITPHSKNKKKKKIAKGVSALNDGKGSKALLYGTSVENSKNGSAKCACGDDECVCDDLQKLGETDVAIEKHLDGIGTQLDGLLTLSKTIDSETRRQDRTIGEIERQIDDAKDKQAVANSRARRFLTGQKRQEYEKNFTLFGAF